MADTITWDTAAIEAADDSLHKKRVQGIMEAALGAALKKRIDGTMTQADWDAMEKAITALEQAGKVTLDTINGLLANTVASSTVAAGAQRVQAVADAMTQAIAAATLARGTPPATGVKG